MATSDTGELSPAGTKPRRRAPRTSTTFQLAHPAPTLTQKQRLIHIRPRLLLQLQRLSRDSRPEPAIDVLPSAVVVPRLARKFPRMFRGKAVLGMNDVLVVRSEEYESQDDSTTETADSDEENLASRDMMAVICQMPKDAGGALGKAEIVMSDGSVWTATPLLNGLYEFTTSDERCNKTTARWVKRSTRRSSADFSSGVPSATPFKYTFSIIDPNSRRHPIMGTLTQSTLDIPDFYTSVSPSAKKHPPTTHIRPLFSEHDSMDDEPSPERTTHPVEEDVKRLVQVTGIWVALREGLSPYFKYNDCMAAGATSHKVSHGRARSASLTPEPKRPAMSGGPEPGHAPRTAVGKLCRARATAPGPAAPGASSSQTEAIKDTPQRSTSAGAAFMQRVAARRGWRPQSTSLIVSSDSDGDSIRRPARRSMTEYGLYSTPPPSIPGSFTTTPDTPTRPPQRRVLSAYTPSPIPTFEAAATPSGQESAGLQDEMDLEWVVKPKVSRWKAFTNLFRRAHPQAV